jgi:hypothetical protein
LKSRGTWSGNNVYGTVNNKRKIEDLKERSFMNSNLNFHILFFIILITTNIKKIFIFLKDKKDQLPNVEDILKNLAIGHAIAGKRPVSSQKRGTWSGNNLYGTVNNKRKYDNIFLFCIFLILYIFEGNVDTPTEVLNNLAIADSVKNKLPPIITNEVLNNLELAKTINKPRGEWKGDNKCGVVNNLADASQGYLLNKFNN